MRRPADFNKLTEADLEKVKALENDAERWFEEDHETYPSQRRLAKTLLKTLVFKSH